MNVSVREIQVQDIEPLCDYWYNSDPEFMVGMGVDLGKMVEREILSKRLARQISFTYQQKSSYAIIWLIDDVPVGHCNLGDIEFGNKAFMHLHMWYSKFRKKGLGTVFIKKALPYFFENIELQELLCQPFAQNLAPIKTLEKVGFEFVKEYHTVPGSINFEQSVKLWRMSKERFEELYNKY